MAWDACLEQLMPDTITVTSRASSTSPNLSGAPNWSTSASTYKARIVETPQGRHMNDGTVVEITHTIWAASTGTIHPHDKVTLPDGSAPAVLTVAGFPDQDGMHHWRIELGRR